MTKKIKSLLRVPAIISSVRTLVDGGLSLGVTTQELIPEDAVELFKLKGKSGYMVFKESKISKEDVVSLPDEVKEFPKSKSLSERLRNVMYVKWNQLKELGKMNDDFEEYRKRQMNAIIDQYKETLDDKN